MPSRDVIKALGLTFAGGVLIKGKRIAGALRELIDAIYIKFLPINFASVATAMDLQCRV